ncbi:MAG: hypothetical protein ISP49_07605 [Reyranella sp.]|jgi:hypothetical protein|nr:hypothetical protein [Reyranella sp.]MBL6651441.1 hypothetical protein [Reyranella sp.]
MMDKGHWRGLLALSSLALLAGCSWFGDSAPVGRARPGADRSIAPTGTLPSASPGQGAQPGVAPVDETRGSTPVIGSVVGGKGGQKAQKDAEEKAAVERDAKAREQRAAQDAAERDAKAKQQSAPAQATPVAVPASPEAAPAQPKP